CGSTPRIIRTTGVRRHLAMWQVVMVNSTSREVLFAINISGLNSRLFPPPLAFLDPLQRAPARRATEAPRDFAVGARNARSIPAGHMYVRKKSSLMIILAGSLTASGFAGFQLLTRSR